MALLVNEIIMSFFCIPPKNVTGLFMKNVFYFLAYLTLFIIGFSILKSANILDFTGASVSRNASNFIIMIVFLIAITRWGIKAYAKLTGYKK